MGSLVWQPQCNWTSYIAAGESQRYVPRETIRNYIFFSNLFSEIMQHHFHHILITEALTQGMSRFKGRPHQLYLFISGVSKYLQMFKPKEHTMGYAFQNINYKFINLFLYLKWKPKLISILAFMNSPWQLCSSNSPIYLIVYLEDT